MLHLSQHNARLARMHECPATGSCYTWALRPRFRLRWTLWECGRPTSQATCVNLCLLLFYANLCLYCARYTLMALRCPCQLPVAGCGSGRTSVPRPPLSPGHDAPGPVHLTEPRCPLPQPPANVWDCTRGSHSGPILQRPKAMPPQTLHAQPPQAGAPPVLPYSLCTARLCAGHEKLHAR